MSDYSCGDLRNVLNKLPLELGDAVFSHSNIGFFGLPEGIANREETCQLFADAILERVGPNGTLVAPTFTYSFPRKNVFDPQNSVSNMGVFAEWLRKQPGSHRSVDPCYSVTAVGGAALELTSNLSKNAFDENSFFGRFYHLGGKILNLNFDAGSTFVHYVERKLDVPYRFDKTFEGITCVNGLMSETESTIWVRYRSDNSLEAAFEGFDKLAREQGIFQTQRLGRGEIGVITTAATYDLIHKTIPLRPWFLTKAEALGISSPIIIPE